MPQPSMQFELYMSWQLLQLWWSNAIIAMIMKLLLFASSLDQFAQPSDFMLYMQLWWSNAIILAPVQCKIAMIVKLLRCFFLWIGKMLRTVGKIINWHNRAHAVVTLGNMSLRDWGSYVGCQDLTNALVVLNQQFLHLLLLYEHIMHIYLKNLRVYTHIYTLV